MNNFDEVYELLIEHEKLDDINADKIYLNDNINKFCRFCFPTEDLKTFKKIAHAIPETIDNKRLISKNECDNCNSKFGISIEDDFGKFIMPFKVISKTFGKNNKITCKDNVNPKNKIVTSKSKNIFDDFEEASSKCVIQDSSDSNFTEFDKNNGTLKIRIPRQTYIPINVYKAFIKMFISILPTKNFGEELENIVNNIVFVVSNEKLIGTDNIVDEIYCCGIETLTNEKNGHDTNIKLYRKKKEELIHPYFMLIVSFSFFRFHIPIWSHTKDFPSDQIYDKSILFDKKNTSIFRKVFLSSGSKKIDDKEEFFLQGDLVVPDGLKDYLQNKIDTEGKIL